MGISSRCLILPFLQMETEATSCGSLLVESQSIFFFFFFLEDYSSVGSALCKSQLYLTLFCLHNPTPPNSSSRPRSSLPPPCSSPPVCSQSRILTSALIMDSREGQDCWRLGSILTPAWKPHKIDSSACSGDNANQARNPS